MKVTMLTKRISTNVIAATADEAVRLLLTQDECKGFDVLNSSCGVVVAPGAVEKTIEFAESTGIYVVGHYPGLQPAPTLRVWQVTLDLEYAVDFTPPSAKGSDPTTPGRDLQPPPQPTSNGSSNTIPVWEEPIGSGLWYHGDETESAVGPFPSQLDAYKAGQEYFKQLKALDTSKTGAPDLSQTITPE